MYGAAYLRPVHSRRPVIEGDDPGTTFILERHRSLSQIKARLASTPRACIRPQMPREDEQMTAAQAADHWESAGRNSADGRGAARGQRVLVVEQEGRLAAAVRDTLERAGYRVEGPAVTVAQALACLELARPDAAILDLDLSGSWSVPVARALGRQGVPFLLLTNHPCPGFLDAAYDQAWRLERPLRRNQLVRSLQRAIRRTASRRENGAPCGDDGANDRGSREAET